LNASCDRQLALEIIVSMQALQEWIGHDIRIGKEPAFDARAERTHRRRFVSQHRVRLGDLVHRFRIAGAARRDLAFRVTQYFGPVPAQPANAFAESLADPGL
jgi:hypothetical protein